MSATASISPSGYPPDMAEKEDDDRICLSMFPTEILLKIFFYLPTRQFFNCRGVCVRWKDVVDGARISKNLWEESTKAEFKDIYELAFKKAQPNMSWFQMYRTLCAWRVLRKAQQVSLEFFPGDMASQEIIGFQILKNSAVGLLTKGSLDYYNLETFGNFCVHSIPGEFIQYTEDEDYVLLMNRQRRLFIHRKKMLNKAYNKVEIRDVRRYLLVGNKIYYTVCHNHRELLYMINLKATTLVGEYLTKFNEHVVSWGTVDGRLYYVSPDIILFKLVDKEFIMSSALSRRTNVLHVLNKYDLIERLDWDVYYHWMRNNYIGRNKELCNEITVMKSYGDIVLVGCKWAILRIYYAPYVNGILEIFTCRPVRQFRLVEVDPQSTRVTLCPILGIDAAECEDGHLVFAATPKKIVKLHFTYDFEMLKPKPKNYVCPVEFIEITPTPMRECKL